MFDAPNIQSLIHTNVSNPLHPTKPDAQLSPAWDSRLPIDGAVNDSKIRQFTRQFTPIPQKGSFLVWA